MTNSSLKQAIESAIESAKVRYIDEYSSGGFVLREGIPIRPSMQKLVTLTNDQWERVDVTNLTYKHFIVTNVGHFKPAMLSERVHPNISGNRLQKIIERTLGEPTDYFTREAITDAIRKIKETIKEKICEKRKIALIDEDSDDDAGNCSSSSSCSSSSF